MRVTFLLSSLRLSGGVIAVVEYANRLAARGHSPTLVAPAGTTDSSMAAEIGAGVAVRESALGLARGGFLHNGRLAWSLARATPASDVIVSTHTPTTASAWMTRRLLGRGPAVWLYMDYPAMFAARPLEGWLLRNAMHWHDMAMTISRPLAEELTPKTTKPVHYVGLGMAHRDLLTPIPFAERTRTAERTILYLGDSRPRKGLADLLAACEIVRQDGIPLRLVIASKEDFAPQTTLPFEFHLRPSYADLARLYQTCDLFVSASWAEGLGWPPLEAMACATPVVLTDSGGSRDYARDGINALVTPPQDPAALANAMRRVLEDDALAQRLSDNGPTTAARYDWAVVVDRLEQCLLRAAAPHSG